MKKIYSIYVLLLTLTFGFTSCDSDKDDPKPAAQSAFSQNRKVIEVSEQVSFTNSSINATRYEWDFGNGQTSTVASPTAIYTTSGTYTVKLTSFNSENVANTTSSIVRVGERYLTHIKINSLNFSNSSGGNWDFTDGPDLLFKLRRSTNSNWEYIYDLGNNYTQVILPKTLALQTPIKFTNENWNFQLEDFDSPDPNDVMDTWNGNPNLFGQKDYNTGIGSLKLTDPSLDIELIFEIK